MAEWKPVKLPVPLIEQLDVFRGSRSRATALRGLLDGRAPGAVDEDVPADRSEALGLLSASARRGVASAQIALCRELREGASPGDPIAVHAARLEDELLQRRRARGVA